MGRSEDKQNDIVSAAIKEFSEKGVMATTMEAIAYRANVSKRTLYKHYPCKNNLLDLVVDQLLAQIATLKEVNYDANIPIEEQLKKLALLLFTLSSDKDYIKLSRILIIESIRSETSAHCLNTKWSNCEQGLQCWFNQASEAGALGDIDPKLAAVLFYGGLKKIAYWGQVISWLPAIGVVRDFILFDSGKCYGL